MSQVPATQADMNYSSGLDDFNTSDAVTPRIRIEHKEGLWSENLTNNKFPELRFIVLGLIKQRVLFHAKVDEGDVPMCKSTNYIDGFPNPDAPRQKSFPWADAGFNPADYPEDSEGNRKLPCAACQLKEWGSHPSNQSPYCADQWTMPIYYDSSGLPDGTDWTPAILTLQKSSIKPIRSYLTSFKASNNPPFIAICKGTLKTFERGQVVYSIPSFMKEGQSDQSRWEEFGQQYLEMREYLTRPPVREVDDTTAPPQYAAQPVQQQPPAQPVQQQPPAQPVQQQPPAQPVQQQPPAQQGSSYGNELPF